MSSATIHVDRAREAAAQPTRTPRPTRDPWFDNAKMLLVTLVVVGHSWTLLPESWLVDRTYDWLYLWHIPAFVLVTGYLSRRFTYSRRNLRRLVTTLVLPYLVFEGLFALLRVDIGGEKLERLWLNPHWPMWYLCVLVLWRLATPALRRTPHVLAVAVGISLLGGLVSVETLDVNRALGLLPFFTVGLVAEQRHLDLLRSRAARRAGVAVLVAGVVAAHLVESRASTEWLYYRSSYASLDVEPLQGMAIRAALLVVGLTMALSVLAWVPRTGGWFSALGAGSLVVYLFHGFYVKGAEYAGVPGWAADHAVLAFLVLTTVSVGVALTLSWRPVRTPLEKVVTPDP